MSQITLPEINQFFESFKILSVQLQAAYNEMNQKLNSLRKVAQEEFEVEASKIMQNCEEKINEYDEVCKIGQENDEEANKVLCIIAQLNPKFRFSNQSE